MMALFSLAWWGQRLASAGLVAALCASLAGAAIVGLGTTAWWLRADAAADARSQCVIEQTTAKRQADSEVAARVKESERIARSQREALEGELAQARARAAELDDLLRQKPAAVCWSREISRKLNEARRQLK